jgi:lipopolysaccharide/colanic/teichoic acid biosynthesis glycosyltransferase
VGPRDIIPQELQDHYSECKDVFLSVKPGLTGLWQVSGRSRLPYSERVRLDLEYIRTRSIWLDLKLIMRTPSAVWGGDGAV